MSSRLNFFLFISFALGVIGGGFQPSFFTFLILFLSSLFLAYFCYKKNRVFLSDWFILIIFLCLGGLWQISNQGAKIDSFLNKERKVTLKVISLPKTGKVSNSLVGQIEKIGPAPLKQRVRVRDYTQSLQYLDRYQFVAKLTKKKYHGRWFYYLWLKSKPEVKKLPLGFWERLAKQSSNYLLSVFEKNCSLQAKAFLAAIFLGRRELLEDEREYFSRIGASHLLAISGLHIGLTSLILFFLLGLFGLTFRLRLAVSLVFLYFYSFVSGATPSTLRAVIMYSVFSFSFFLKRRPQSLNSLGLAGLICLLIDPAMLFTISFQLSFLAVFGILIGYQLFPLRLNTSRILAYTLQIFFCSLWVTLFVGPLVSYYFGQIHLLAIVYNIFLIPFFTFILALNFILIIFSPLGFIAQSLGALLSVLISGFVSLVKALSSFRLSYLNYQISLSVLLLYYSILAIILGRALLIDKKGVV